MPPCQGAPAVELYWETDDSTQPDRPDTENIAKKTTFKGTVRPDWICIRVVSLENPLKGHKPLYVFNFLFLTLNIWQEFKVLSRSMQKGLQSSCLFGSRFACAQAVIFFAKPYSINAGVTSIVLWVEAWEWRTSSFRNPNQQRAGLWWIFSWVTVRQPIGRQDSMQIVNRTSRRLDSFLHGAAQNFELL